ncbi:hypothetical protein OV079_04480 [Nannocystis pusilla]|uniref:Uncharacterized protein n=1 Tax=Nannocystis pusilla TaxID=889268 RepID=A0A9X3IVF4_9BACT|nr:hypothetical protein [Nannocystis pusilla]MCY1004840.1 hypothetical protein [Nannocystis pusilla]
MLAQQAAGGTELFTRTAAALVGAQAGVDALAQEHQPRAGLLGRGEAVGAGELLGGARVVAGLLGRLALLVGEVAGRRGGWSEGQVGEERR